MTTNIFDGYVKKIEREFDRLFSSSDTIIVKGAPSNGKTRVVEALKINVLKSIPQTSTMTKTCVRLPSEFTSNDELEKWKKEIKKFTSEKNQKLILGRNYVVELLLSEIKSFDLLKDVEKKIHFVTDLLNSMIHKHRIVNTSTMKEFTIALREADARIIIKNLHVPENLEEQVLEFSKFRIREFHNEYFLSLLEKGAELAKTNPQKLQEAISAHIKLERNFIKDEMITAVLFGILAEGSGHLTSFTMTTIQNYGHAIWDVIGSLSFPIQSAIVFIAGAFVGYREFKDKGVKPLLELYEAWNSNDLPDERKEQIAYSYDRALHLVPGTTKRAFDSFFGKNDQVFRKELDEMHQKMASFVDKASQIEEEIEILNRHMGVLSNPKHLGLSFNHNMSSCMMELQEFGKKKEVQLVTDNEYDNNVNNLLNKIITDQPKRIAIIGPHGAGKSVFTKYALANLMLHRKRRLVALHEISIQKVNMIMNLAQNLNLLIYYDPSSVEVYEERETIGTEYSDLSSYAMKLGELLKFDCDCVVVIPDDLWRKLPSGITNKFETINLRDKFNNKPFLKNVIKSHAMDSHTNDTDLDEIINLIQENDSGHMLLASSIGSWLSKNELNSKEIRETLLKTKKRPIAFLQNYIYRAILKLDPAYSSQSNYRDARIYAAAIITRTCIGPMTVQMAEFSPYYLVNNSEALAPDVSRWIAAKQEDLIENALVEFVHGQLNTDDPIYYLMSPLLDEINKIMNELIPDYQKSKNIRNKILDKLNRSIVSKLSLSEDSIDDLFQLGAEIMVNYTNSYTQNRDNSINKLLFEKDTLPVGSKNLLLGVSPDFNGLTSHLSYNSARYGHRLEQLILDSPSTMPTNEKMINLLSFSHAISLGKEINTKHISDALRVTIFSLSSFKPHSTRIHLTMGKKLAVLALKSDSLEPIRWTGQYVYSLFQNADFDNNVLDDSVRPILLEFEEKGVNKFNDIIILLNFLAVKVIIVGKVGGYNDLLETENEIEKLKKNTNFQYLITSVEVGTRLAHIFNNNFHNEKKAEYWSNEASKGLEIILNMNKTSNAEMINRLQYTFPIYSPSDAFTTWKLATESYLRFVHGLAFLFSDDINSAIKELDIHNKLRQQTGQIEHVITGKSWLTRIKIINNGISALPDARNDFEQLLEIIIQNRNSIREVSVKWRLIEYLISTPSEEIDYEIKKYKNLTDLSETEADHLASMLYQGMLGVKGKSSINEFKKKLEQYASNLTTILEKNKNEFDNEIIDEKYTNLIGSIPKEISSQGKALASNNSGRLALLIYGYLSENKDLMISSVSCAKKQGTKLEKRLFNECEKSIINDGIKSMELKNCVYKIFYYLHNLPRFESVIS